MERHSDFHCLFAVKRQTKSVSTTGLNRNRSVVSVAAGCHQVRNGQPVRSLRVPRINHIATHVQKRPCVSRSYGKAMCQSDCRNSCICKFYLTSNPSCGGSAIGEKDCCRNVKILYAAVKGVPNQRFNALSQLGSVLAFGQICNAKAQLCNSNSQSEAMSCIFNQSITPESGIGFMVSETTLVSSIIIRMTHLEEANDRARTQRLSDQRLAKQIAADRLGAACHPEKAFQQEFCGPKPPRFDPQAAPLPLGRGELHRGFCGW